MTVNETTELLAIIASMYPNFRVDNKSVTIKAWHMVLEDFDYKDIMTGLKLYARTENNQFAPSVNQIIAMTHKPASLCQMDFITAWRFIRKAISRSLYYSEEEFEKLPEEAQKAVGDPSQLREWAQLPSETIDSVTRSKVESQFNALQKRNAELAAMPEDVRELIEKSTPKLPERQIVRAIEAKPEEGGVSESALDSGMDKLKSVLGG